MSLKEYTSKVSEDGAKILLCVLPIKKPKKMEKTKPPAPAYDFKKLSNKVMPAKGKT